MEFNPFIAGLVIEAAEMYNKPMYTNLVEREPPASLFMDDNMLNVLKQLSKGANEMLYYILRYLGTKKDTIEIVYETYNQRLGGDISIRSFYKSREELINVFIVKKKSRKNTYFINPNYIFRGSRIKAFPANVSVTWEHPYATQLREMKIIPERIVHEIEVSPED